MRRVESHSAKGTKEKLAQVVRCGGSNFNARSIILVGFLDAECSRSTAVSYVSTIHEVTDRTEQEAAGSQILNSMVACVTVSVSCEKPDTDSEPVTFTEDTTDTETHTAIDVAVDSSTLEETLEETHIERESDFHAKTAINADKYATCILSWWSTSKKNHH